MFFCYRLLIAVIFYTILPCLLLFVFVTGKHRQGVLERFGFYPLSAKVKQYGNIYWLHAASVGEVQAARAIISALEKIDDKAKIIVTTMTLHGRNIARRQLKESVCCFLAPLDIPWIVERAVRKIAPSCYICIETELWPILIDSLSRKGVKVCMANGRISDRAYRKYLQYGVLFKHTMGQFGRMAVISENYRAKYIELGAEKERIKALGNVKYDLTFSLDRAAIKQKYRKILNINNEEVFIAGSTHTGEENLLLNLYINIFDSQECVFLMAPRHVERIEDIEILLQKERINYQLFSNILNGTEVRQKSMILVDTMGELAQLYSVSTYIFCGGSLVPKGGHNIMEAAVWQKAPFYGPHMDDFKDAVDLLASGQCSYQISGIADMENQILNFRKQPGEYRNACEQAGKIAQKLQGCSLKQVAYILEQRPAPSVSSAT